LGMIQSPLVLFWLSLSVRFLAQL